ncbi:hypothetical protein XMG59_001158 [Marinobacterium sp. xm-g-59]|uniref:hypothetical protein n=1 Tax=Marinobacterium sp. xm-g-59 TaxID=2497748 RepID=UPI0015682811|nr:hypothetical protein [Marinobacterium sp. xm-g-59]NRP95062.1 hypothetical protein [Marinobacterium sp. xm-g-59]
MKFIRTLPNDPAFALPVLIAQEILNAEAISSIEAKTIGQRLFDLFEEWRIGLLETGNYFIASELSDENCVDLKPWEFWSQGVFDPLDLYLKLKRLDDGFFTRVISQHIDRINLASLILYIANDDREYGWLGEDVNVELLLHKCVTHIVIEGNLANVHRLLDDTLPKKYKQLEQYQSKLADQRLARKGAVKKSEKHQDLQKYAVQLFNEGGFPKMAVGARQILDAVNEYNDRYLMAKKVPANERNIISWLSAAKARGELIFKSD